MPTANRLSFTLLATFVASSALASCLSAQTPQEVAASAEVRTRYTKREVRIPMRDGTTLFTTRRHDDRPDSDQQPIRGAN